MWDMERVINVMVLRVRDLISEGEMYDILSYEIWLDNEDKYYVNEREEEELIEGMFTKMVNNVEEVLLLIDAGASKSVDSIKEMLWEVWQ